VCSYDKPKQNHQTTFLLKAKLPFHWQKQSARSPGLYYHSVSKPACTAFLASFAMYKAIILQKKNTYATAYSNRKNSNHHMPSFPDNV
jgi:hypothetical protein